MANILDSGAYGRLSWRTTGLRFHITTMAIKEANSAPPSAPPTAPPTILVWSAGQGLASEDDDGSDVAEAPVGAVVEETVSARSTSVPISNVSDAVELSQQFSRSPGALQQNCPPGLHCSIFQVSTSGPSFQSSLPAYAKKGQPLATKVGR